MFSPEKTWDRKTAVVCAEYHIFAAHLMREIGITAYPVEILSPGLAHVVTVYRDPASGTWDVVDYNTHHATAADSPEEAIGAYDPTYYKMVFLDDGGGTPANRAVFYSPRAQAMRDFMRRPR